MTRLQQIQAPHNHSPIEAYPPFFPSSVRLSRHVAPKGGPCLGWWRAPREPLRLELKYIERYDIPIDYIAGTSIGSVKRKAPRRRLQGPTSWNSCSATQPLLGTSPTAVKTCAKPFIRTVNGRDTLNLTSSASRP